MVSFGFLQRCGIFMLHSKSIGLRDVPVISLIRPRNFSGTFARSFNTSYSDLERGPAPRTDSGFSKSVDTLFRALFNRKSIFTADSSNMGYFVIGVSGVTCGGKTTLTKLLLRKFPWARVIHQDHYFYDDDYPKHIRVPEAENHVNYEILDALNMEQMYKDVQAILDAPPVLETPKQSNGNCSSGVGDKAETPNFDDSFLQQIPDIHFDVSKYNNVPIFIIEGFTVFASQYLFDKCDARFFCSLDKETCRQRRSTREYFPPDTPSFFEKVVWPEYVKHYENYIQQRPGVTVFDGNTLMVDLWKASVQIISCRIEEKRMEETTDPKDLRLDA